MTYEILLFALCALMGVATVFVLPGTRNEARADKHRAVALALIGASFGYFGAFPVAFLLDAMTSEPQPSAGKRLMALAILYGLPILCAAIGSYGACWRYIDADRRD